MTSSVCTCVRCTARSMMFAAANATQTHHKTTGVPRWYTS